MVMLILKTKDVNYEKFLLIDAVKTSNHEQKHPNI